MIFLLLFSSAFVSNLQYILLAYCLNGTYSTVWGNRPIRSSAVNASKDKFIGKVCRELNDTPSPSGQGCAFPSKVDALMAGVPEAVLGSVKKLSKFYVSYYIIDPKLSV